MARLYDDLVSNKVNLSDKDKYNCLEKAELIVADNVFKYIREISNKKDWYLLKDVPNILPPFDNMFIETKNVKPFNSFSMLNNNDKKIFEFTPARWGGHFITFDYKNINQAIDIFHKKNEEVIFKEVNRKYGIYKNPNFKKKYRFFVDIKLYYEINNKIKPINPSFQLIIDSKGKLINCLENVKTARFQEMFAFPFFLATSFMHCKNVEYIENDYPEPVKKKREKRYGKSHKKYKTLKIKPMQKTLQKKGNVEKNGLKKALHICRGHFKDYRENGLFGKYHDIYWWNSHVRGNKKAGEVEKDYEIEVG